MTGSKASGPGSNRFCRRERLRGRKNFAAFAHAKQYRGVYLRFAYTKSDSRKAAFVVSKKVCPLAVDRNRLKRRLRELYRECRYILPSDIQLMVIALPGAANADFKSLGTDIDAAFKKIASKNAGNLCH